MSQALKAAAGIHFSSFKDKPKTEQEREAEAEGAAKVKSNWRPPPHMMRAWTTPKEATEKRDDR